MESLSQANQAEKKHEVNLSGKSDEMEQSTDQKEDSTKEIRKTRNGFILYLLGVLLSFSAFLATMNLQSSLNIEDGLGTISLSTMYITAAVVSILFTPLFVRKFGAKRCLYASDIAHAMLIVANIYPAFYTLIPGAIMAGIGEGMMWICMPVMNVHFGKKYSALKQHDRKGDDYYTTFFSGCFFTAFQICQIFGNLISYVALYAFSTPSTLSEDEESGNTTILSSYTSSYVMQKYYYCGANDCQDPNVVSNSRDQYVPANRVTVIVLISIFSSMCIVSVILHVLFLPDVGFPDKKESKKSKIHVTTHDNDAYKLELNPDQQGHVDGLVRANTENDLGYEQSSYASIYQEIHIVPLMKKSVKDLGKHLVQTKQILIVPITIYNGLSMGFAFSELTRAYSSCVLGVAMIGICMTIYGCADAILSFVIGKYGQKLGKRFFFLLAFAIDIGNYSYCLLWKPDFESSCSIYLIFFTLGFTDGIWQTLINVMYIDYFPKDQEIAQTSWNFLIILGFIAQFTWSSFLCMSIKIYIQFGVLTVGIISYGGSEYVHLKEERRKADEEKSVVESRVAETLVKNLKTF